ncbi:MAG: hypothetical protein P8M16_06945 [Acidimicrobiales bacterium]|nr:hypothetical protein [Acidimicrobiales bacterium]
MENPSQVELDSFGAAVAGLGLLAVPSEAFFGVTDGEAPSLDDLLDEFSEDEEVSEVTAELESSDGRLLAEDPWSFL